MRQCLKGLRDPARRFALFRDPKTYEDAIECAAKEEEHERMTSSRAPAVRSVNKDEDRDRDVLRRRLDRLERL